MRKLKTSDFIDTAICKNCKHFDERISWCSYRKEESYPENHCAEFEESSPDIIPQSHEDDYKEELSEEFEENLVNTFNNPFVKAAMEFIEKNPLYYDNAGCWWAWDHKLSRWGMIDETDLLNAHDREIGLSDSVAPSKKSAILESLRRVSRLKKPKPIRDTWVQFGSTIVDILTGREFPASPQHFVTNPIPWSLGSSTSTPVIDRLLVDWVGEDFAVTLKEIMAFCMLPSYPVARIFCFTGAGSNGKTTFLKLLENVVGFHNICSTELETLLNSRFESAKLHKKLVCQIGETNFDKLSKTSLLKKLVGGDLVSGEFKNKNPFDFRNYAKVIIATNSLPSTDDRTVGFYRRWLVIDFVKSFPKESDVLSQIPSVEYENFCRDSVKLLRNKVLKDGGFSFEGDASVRQQRYDERSDPVQAFISKECVVGEGFEVAFSSFYAKLSHWLKEQGFRALSSKKVGMILSEKELVKDYKNVSRPGGGYSSVLFVRGLMFSDPGSLVNYDVENGEE